MLKRLGCSFLISLSCTDAKAIDLGLVSKGTDFLSGAAISYSPPGAALLAVPGAVVRAERTGEGPVEAYAKHVGEIGVGKIAGSAASSLVSGGFLTKRAVGAAAGTLAKDGYNSLLDAPVTASLGKVGGLQASLSQTDSLTGIKNGIQQYVLMKDEFDTPPPPTKVSRSNAQALGSDPDRQLIGRVPSNGNSNPRNGDQLIGQAPGSGSNGFFDDFLNDTLGGMAGRQGAGARRSNGRNCNAPQYDTPNPQSCF